MQSLFLIGAGCLQGKNITAVARNPPEQILQNSIKQGGGIEISLDIWVGISTDNDIDLPENDVFISDPSLVYVDKISSDF